MKKKAKTLWSLENGEILLKDLHRDTSVRYKADTPFDHSIAPYLVLLFCAAVDGAVFYSLFSAISYDRPLMLAVQVAGFLFGFDMVPIYIGIQLRRLRQGLNRDWFILWLALSVCIVSAAMNTGLRIATVDAMNPSAAMMHTSFLGAAPAAEETADPTAIALTVFGIGIPLVTSMGSFFISYLTYDPLKTRCRREEELMEEKRDEIRRFEAIIGDYDAEPDFAQRMLTEDQGKYDAMQRYQRALVLGYCDYARQRLKEHLGNPTANNILSQEYCAQLLARLDRELACIENNEIETIETVPAARTAGLRRMTL